MKNYFRSLGFILGLFLMASVAHATVAVQSSGSGLCTAEYLNFGAGNTATCSGNVATVTGASGAAAITSGTIDGAVIGGVTPAAGTFTTLRGTSGPALVSTLTTNAVDVANSVWAESGVLAFEGATADTAEGRITSSDWTADRTLTLPDDSGTFALQSSTALTPGSTVTWNPASGSLFTLTPAQAETINMTTTRAVAGAHTALVITTSGTTTYTITFSTNFKTIGTLETGTTSGIVYTIGFDYDGTNWNESSRRRSGGSVIAVTAANPALVDWAEGVTTYTYTPTGTGNINASVVARAGAKFDLLVLTSGTSSFTLTFNTNFKSTGTLATGTVDSKMFVMEFVSNGTSWYEKSRTTAQ